MPRLIHTADWQLGLKLRRLSGERGARARDARFRVVERIATLAHERSADAVVVAGDVFDDNHVSPWLLQKARDVLVGFAPIPVVLLPGNHDCAVPGGALERLLDGTPGLDHVHVATTSDPLPLGGLVFHPCPLHQRHSATDPTLDLPARRPGDGAVRVVIAHGGVHGFGEATETPNRIDVPRLLEKGFDYVALGDWHGLLRHDARAWYSGAPEATRFVEKAPGQVLEVELPAAGAEPVVTPHEVQGLRWHERTLELDGAASVDALDAWLSGLSPRSDTLVRLHLTGHLTVEERATLDAVLAKHAEALLSLQLPDDDVRTTLDAAALEALDLPGFLGEALQELATHDDEASRDAAALLHRLLAEEGLA